MSRQLEIACEILKRYGTDRPEDVAGACHIVVKHVVEITASPEIPTAVVEQLRAAGYAVVPLRPSEEMVKVGAPRCFQPASAQSDQDWNNALSDATACYQAMVELGCL